MYKQITIALLRYLLDNHFDSSADMARQLDMTERHMQRIIKEGVGAKGGTIALDKALCYCAQKRISLDVIIEDVLKIPSEERVNIYGHPAFQNLRMSCPDHISEEGIEVYHSMLRFLQKASAKVCPTCTEWCNPWSGRQVVEDKDCYIGHIAQEIVKSLREIYLEEGADV